MTGTEHAIEQAAQAIRRTREFQAGAAFGVPEDASEDYALGVARALAEAGLLAPAPLREEWSTRFPNGYMRPGKDMPYDSWWKGDPPKGVNVRRYVSGWLPADPARPAG